jgi:ariadne-1
MACGHFHCHECWRRHVESELKAGSILHSRCMGLLGNSRCHEAIDLPTMQKFLPPLDFEKYRSWLLDSFVKDSRTIKLCKNPHCNLAIEYTQGGDIDVTCTCKFKFCFGCDSQPHAPVPCDISRKWNSTGNDPEAATASWIARMTKACPKCTTRTEKNKACNHMHCSRCQHDWYSNRLD